MEDDRDLVEIDEDDDDYDYWNGITVARLMPLNALGIWINSSRDVVMGSDKVILNVNVGDKEAHIMSDGKWVESDVLKKIPSKVKKKAEKKVKDRRHKFERFISYLKEGKDLDMSLFSGWITDPDKFDESGQLVEPFSLVRGCR